MAVWLAVAAWIACARPVSALSPEATEEAASAVDEKRAASAVDALCAPALGGRKVGTPGAAGTVAWLARAFGDAGLKPVGAGEGASFRVPAGEDVNVLGAVPGTDRAAEAIVVSAHWDGVGSDETGALVPGADENASGVAALLEAARVLAKTRPRRTLVFAAFGGAWDKDDSRRFRGARAFVKEFGDGKAGWKPIAQACLYSVGVPLLPKEPERFFALGSESSGALTTIVKDLASGPRHGLKLARASADLVEKRGPRDDYDAFRSGAVPFLLLTSGVSKHFHKPGDVPGTVDARRVAAAARLAIELVARLDALEAAPTFVKDPPRDEKGDLTEVLSLLEAALDERSGIALSTSERRALGFKRDKVKSMLESGTPLTVRERGVLKDSLELLLAVLTK